MPRASNRPAPTTATRLLRGSRRLLPPPHGCRQKVLHMYRFDKRSADDGQFWRCLNFLKSGCPGRIKTDCHGVFIEYRNSQHSHPVNPDDVQVREVVTTMKNRARTETTNLASVYRQEMAAFAGQPSVASALPTFTEVCGLNVHMKSRKCNVCGF